MGWEIFKELYLKVLLSVLVVISAMLLLQGGLNQLKLRALVADATTSRHQIAARAIEDSIVRAEAIGLSINQMPGLQELIDRERAEDPTIIHIIVVNAVGAPLLFTGALDDEDDEDEGFEVFDDALDFFEDDSETYAAELDRVLRRVLTSREQVSHFDAGERLYSGRRLYDSSDAVMGAILIVAETETYIANAKEAFVQLRLIYAAIFVVCAVLLVPLVIFQFSRARYAILMLDPEAVEGNTRTPRSVDAADLQRLTAEGAAKVDEIQQELSQIIGGQPAGTEERT